MFAIADISAATGGCMANNGQKMAKVRYGNYYSTITADKWGENDEIKVLKRMKKAEERLKGRKMEEENDREQRGRAKRLVEKLAKLLTAGDLPFLTASRKTMPKAKKQNNMKKLQLHQQQQQRSRNSSQSNLFEPMPTIREETDTELMGEDAQNGEETVQPRKNGTETWGEWRTEGEAKKCHSDKYCTKAQQFGTTQPMLQKAI
ncbi:hypothetical protein niasHT_023883 [Heterodera trifolii]|uniref:Uncharacterized protein n=1 Tax=Heterodera trifolii TaxID=157864 RepID=A0ABD2JCI0_9BILA